MPQPPRDNTTISQNRDLRTTKERQSDANIRAVQEGIKAGQRLQGLVVSGGPGFGVGLANDPFVQTAATSLVGGGASRLLGIKNLSIFQQFAARSSTDAILQGVIKGDFRKIDFFDATISGIGFKSAPLTQGFKTLFSFNINDGFTVKTNAADITLEFGLRMSTDKFFGLGKTGNNLVDDIGIGLIKKKVINDASQFKGKIGFGL